MPAAPLIIAGASLAVAAVGTVASISASNKQAKFNNQSRAFQAQQANMQAANQKRDAIRAARMAAGQAEQVSVNQGVQGGSANLGGLGSIQSQLGGNLSFLDKYGALSDQASTSLGKAADAGNTAAVFGQVANLGFTAFNASDKIGKVFGGK